MVLIIKKNSVNNVEEVVREDGFRIKIEGS